jgi:hypothetical protein
MNRANYFGSLSRPRLVRVIAVFILLWFLHFIFFGGSSQSNPSRLATNNGEPTWTLVVASRKSDDTSWIQKEMRGIESAVYVADDPKSKFKVPTKKGNEAMVYITYIIDHYDSLPDVSVFIHTRQRPHSNDELLSGSVAKSLGRLRLKKAVRDKYFNLRCNWEPGCPSWLNLRNASASAPQVNPNDASMMRDALRDLMPAAPIPEWVGQPFGSQFAASREGIHSVPLDLWKTWREWLINTPFNDEQSGRVWEHIWQYAFTGKTTFCPAMDQCYCEGYGICFTSATKFVVWRAWTRESLDWTMEYLKLKSEGREAQELKERIDARNEVLQLSLSEAMRWGDELRDRGEEHSHYGKQYTEEEEAAMYSS